MTFDELANNELFQPDTPAEVVLFMNRSEAIHSHRYCSFIQFVNDSVVLRTWAYRRNWRHGLEYTEVERKCTTSKMAVRRNIYLTAMSGYRPLYKPQTCANGNWYGYTYYNFDAADYNRWFHDKPMGLYTKIVNLPALFKTQKYKYCGYSVCDLIEYLRMYDKDPTVEFFGKLKIPLSTKLMNKCKKDKGFRRYLFNHAEQVNIYGVLVTIYSYDHGIGFSEARVFLKKKREAEQITKYLAGCKQLDRIKIADYMNRSDVGRMNYTDYWNAITYLGLDVFDTKNTFPKDFKRMHDLRIAEYASKKAEENEKAKREMAKSFYQNAMRYKPLELHESDYSICIPTKPADLKREGRLLHHCVGRMGYDKKMADGTSFIAFVRRTGEPYKPFVTVEYDTKNYKVLQCYADHDSRPDSEIIEFANRFGCLVKEQLQTK